MAKRIGKYKVSQKETTLSLADGGTITGKLVHTDSAVSNYHRWSTGDYSGLSLATKTDANCDSGFTFAVDTYHECAPVGDATNAFVLPSLAPGADSPAEPLPP